MDDLKGIGYLRQKLALYRSKVLDKYEIYNMEDPHILPEAAIPARVAVKYRQNLGWCTRAVDQLSGRLIFRGFKNDRFGMGDIFNYNNRDILTGSAVKGALISACNFIYISVGEDGRPKMQGISGANATGILDKTTYFLKEGYAVLKRDPDSKAPLIEAYFTPTETAFYYAGEKDPEIVKNPTGYPLLVPIINEPSDEQEFGKSRISRAMVKMQHEAEDVLTRAAVSAEFYSWPQKYILGLDESAQTLDTWKATVSAMLRFDKDEDGGVPQLGQFSQQSMAPHIDHFRLCAQIFAGESGLTLDDLGFLSENPSSAEAIKAGHEPLRVMAAECQRTFGIAFVNAGFLCCCLRDGERYDRNSMYETSVLWAPIIEPDAAMLSSIGDGAIKINQAIPEFFTAATLSELTGIQSEEV